MKKLLKNIGVIIFLFSLLISNFSCKDSNNDKSGKINTSSNEKGKLSTSIIVPTEANKKGVIKNIHIGCGYNYKPEEKEIELFLAGNRETDEIKKILSYSGVPLNFEIYSANINNAIATIIDSKRYIIYDPRLLQFTDKLSDSYWTSVSILAHEIGHHLSGHTLDSTFDNHKAELEADKFSGFVLYKMGATLTQSTKAITILGSQVDSKTHPNKQKRIIYIQKGWDEALAFRYDGAVPPPINDNFDYGTYTMRMLITKKFYDVLYDSQKDYNGDFYIGIITETKKDQQGDLVLQVLVTKREKGKLNDGLDMNSEKVWIYTDNEGFGEEMANIPYKKFLALIKPGRRIKFAIIEGPGSAGGFTLSYIKEDK
jgi:hypothetical protein